MNSGSGALTAHAAVRPPQAVGPPHSWFLYWNAIWGKCGANHLLGGNMKTNPKMVFRSIKKLEVLHNHSACKYVISHAKVGFNLLLKNMSINKNFQAHARRQNSYILAFRARELNIYHFHMISLIFLIWSSTFSCAYIFVIILVAPSRLFDFFELPKYILLNLFPYFHTIGCYTTLD